MNMTRCPECGVTLKKSKLQRHMQKCPDRPGNLRYVKQKKNTCARCASHDRPFDRVHFMAAPEVFFDLPADSRRRFDFDRQMSITLLLCRRCRPRRFLHASVGGITSFTFLIFFEWLALKRWGPTVEPNWLLMLVVPSIAAIAVSVRAFQYSYGEDDAELLKKAEEEAESNCSLGCKVLGSRKYRSWVSSLK